MGLLGGRRPIRTVWVRMCAICVEWIFFLFGFGLVSEKTWIWFGMSLV